MNVLIYTGSWPPRGFAAGRCLPAFLLLEPPPALQGRASAVSVGVVIRPHLPICNCCCCRARHQPSPPGATTALPKHCAITSSFSLSPSQVCMPEWKLHAHLAPSLCACTAAMPCILMQRLRSTAHLLVHVCALLPLPRRAAPPRASLLLHDLCCHDTARK